STDDRYQYIFPSTELQHFSFGLDEVLAHTHWVRVLPDADVCTDPKAEATAPRQGLNRTPHRELDWVYHMIHVTTELAPRFYFAYVFGGIVLSVTIDDVLGAKLIYEKGIARFPKDWHLAFSAATHLMTETSDVQSAAYLFQ